MGELMTDGYRPDQLVLLEHGAATNVRVPANLTLATMSG
jgi:hypothetical protein